MVQVRLALDQGLLAAGAVGKLAAMAFIAAGSAAVWIRAMVHTQPVDVARGAVWKVRYQEVHV